ncbi:MAG: TetR/AcrR family transcriptional regulator [Spirochaetaceae bacterium]|nr:TetR/AcrR family transcriptional regulator [Spirochaetaceae bacterium]
MRKSGKQNGQPKRTKSYIFDALLLLMDEKPYNKITVSDITKRAGIARQTFYRNYNKKNDIIEQYLTKSFNMELLMPENAEGDTKKSGLVLTFDLGYIISHKENLMKIILKINIENLFSSRFREWSKDLKNLIDNYRDKLSAEEYEIYRYNVYYQAIGSMYILADWLKNDMPLPVEKLRSFLNGFILPDSLQHKHIPNIIIRLKNE